MGWGFGVGFGTGLAVGVGVGVASPWNWGYFSYYNPYWIPPVAGVTYINYAQPVVVTVPVSPAQQMGLATPAPTAFQASVSSTPTTAPSVPTTSTSASFPGMTRSPTDQALSIFDNARSLFRQGNYREALNEVDRAVQLVPNDSLMHEFRALCLFALKDYQQSAAAVHAVVSAGPGWDWPTVNNLYLEPNIYNQQLQELETYCRENPNASAAHFLLAYHYLLTDRDQQALTTLQEVVRLQPNDQLAAQLLKGLSQPANPQTPVSPPPPPGPSIAFSSADLNGVWRAARPDGSNFELSLTADNKFHWKYQQKDKVQQFEGTYTLANSFLILSASEQNTLIGKIAMEAPGDIHLQIGGGQSSRAGIEVYAMIPWLIP